MLRFGSKTSILALGGLGLAATAAVAGNGVGGVFNLGQTNTVDNAVTTLIGSRFGEMFRVTNRATFGPETVAIVGKSTTGTGVWGESNHIGVLAAARGGGANYGVYANTRSYRGVAGFFSNTGSPPDLTYGTALRALGADATGNEINRRNHAAAAAEFIGYVGVTGASSLADGGAGVLALNGAGDYGIYATSDSPDGQAGYFQNTSTTTSSFRGAGLRALAAGSTGDDFPTFFFRGGGEFSGPNGVIGVASKADGYGVLALQGEGDYALRTVGDAHIEGTLSKSAGTFKIDHPQDPANKYLSHSFVESPEMKNVYDGIVTTDDRGAAVVALPDYFEALNRDPRYQLTVIGSPGDAYISKKISGNSFTIQTETPNVEVSWQVTGIRHDAYAVAHPIVVEENKQLAERGRYLHPEEHGQPAELAIHSAQGLPRQASLALPAR